MKKHLFWKSLTIMMVAMVYVSFTSCSGDDDDSQPDPKGTVNVSAEVVGTWKSGNGIRMQMFIFSNDGTGTAEWSEDNKIERTGTFTWTMESDSRGSMKMSYSDNRKGNLYFEINGNRMTVYDNPEYKSADWYLTKQN